VGGGTVFRRFDFFLSSRAEQRGLSSRRGGADKRGKERTNNGGAGREREGENKNGQGKGGRGGEGRGKYGRGQWGGEGGESLFRL
jgi:hypothetical protein